MSFLEIPFLALVIAAAFIGWCVLFSFLGIRFRNFLIWIHEKQKSRKFFKTVERCRRDFS